MSRPLYLVLTSLLLTAGLSCQSPISGIWHLDETSGLTASDTGPFANHGTLNGYTTNGTWVAGKFNNALSFDGVDDYIDLGRNGGLPIYKGQGAPFSVCFWVKAPAANDDRVYSEGSSMAAAGFGALFTLGSGRSNLGNTDKLQLFIRNDSGIEVAKQYSSTTVFDDTWHHVAYVDVSGDAKLYVDGVLDASSFDYRITGNPVRPNTGTQTANYGKYTMDRASVGGVLRGNVVAHLAGTIDELVILQFALDATDVQTVMANGLPSTCRSSIGEFGVGCGNGPFDLMASGSAAIGGPGIQLQMQNGPANATAFLLIGFGPITPTDLTPLGFTGCTVFPANMFAISSGALDPSGNAPATTIAVPNTPSLACGRIAFQAAGLDPATLSLVFSDVAQAMIGN